MKKSFRIQILFTSDLAFTSQILAGTAGGSAVLTFSSTRHKGLRSRRFTPRQRERGVQGARGWNTSSGPTTGTSKVSIGSSNRREIERLGTARYSVQETMQYIYIYIYAFSRRFYPKRLTVHSCYTYFCQYNRALSQSSPSPADHCVFLGDGGAYAGGI